MLLIFYLAVLSSANTWLFSLFLSCNFVSQPHFGQVWGWSPTLGKVENLKSSGTSECSELDSKAQNNLHWGVLGVIGKVLKRRYRKWPRIGHLDICSPSYGQKKGRESNWQFDSRPLKVGNRPVPNMRSGSATQRWKAFFEGYNFGLNLVPIRGRGEELWSPKVPGLQPRQFRDNFRTPWSEVPVASPNTQGCPGMWTNHVGGLFLMQIQAWSTSPSS
jgi:hypothetical protein